MDADGHLQTRGAHAIPEPVIHRPVTDLTQRAGKVKWLNRLRAVLVDDVFELGSYRLQRFVPSDALEAGTESFGPDSAMRIEHAIFVVNKIHVVIDLIAKISARDWMTRIALYRNSATAAVISGNKH